MRIRDFTLAHGELRKCFPIKLMATKVHGCGIIVFHPSYPDFIQNDANILLTCLWDVLTDPHFHPLPPKLHIQLDGALTNWAKLLSGFAVDLVIGKHIFERQWKSVDRLVDVCVYLRLVSIVSILTKLPGSRTNTWVWVTSLSRISCTPLGLSHSGFITYSSTSCKFLWKWMIFSIMRFEVQLDKMLRGQDDPPCLIDTANINASHTPRSLSPSLSSEHITSITLSLWIKICDIWLWKRKWSNSQGRERTHAIRTLCCSNCSRCPQVGLTALFLNGTVHGKCMICVKHLMCSLTKCPGPSLTRRYR